MTSNRADRKNPEQFIVFGSSLFKGKRISPLQVPISDREVLHLYADIVDDDIILHLGLDKVHRHGLVLHLHSDAMPS